MSHYVGLDVSQDLTAICVVDEQGTITHECAVPTEPAAISACLDSLEVNDHRVGLETGPSTHWLFHALCAAGLPTVCLGARHAYAVMKAQLVKTDKNDARGLAQMVRTGWFKSVHIKSAESQK